MRHQPPSQFTNGEAVFRYNCACVGNARNDSAAACSRRTWFSICSNSSSIGIGRGWAAGDTATRSEKERLRATVLTCSSGWTAKPDDSERVAAPNATAATASPNTNTVAHKPIKNISMTEIPLRHFWGRIMRSEEHTSELQSLTNLVCRLLLEKK